MPRVGREITKAAQMGMIGGAVSVTSRPMTPGLNSWGVLSDQDQSPPPSPDTFAKQVAMPPGLTSSG